MAGTPMAIPMRALTPPFRRERRETPGRASASDSKGSDSSPRVAHHADTRHVHAFSEPLGKGIQDSADVMNPVRSEEHTSELQSLTNLVCRLLLEKKKKKKHMQ